ncbi:MAG TPA: CHASE3 domain-containing protein [Thermomicrobiales bacterium]|nr:CHASE3 domain-containing protein [Thermomicrobiales bacterium]
MAHVPRPRLAARWADLSLRGKGLVVIAIPLIPLLGLLALVAYPLVRPQESSATALVAHTLEVRAALSDVTIQLLDAETGVRGYLLTGQAADLAPYDQARAALPASLARVAGLVQDNPAQGARLQRVEALTARRLELLAALRAGAEPRAAYLAEGQATMDALRTELGAMQAEEDRLLAARTAQAAVERQRGLLILAAILLAGVLGGVAATLLFTASVVRRIQRLAAIADRVTAGQAPPPLPGGADEIGRLGRRLAEAGGLLAARERELRAANARLEERVRARTADLREQAATLARQSTALATANRALTQRNEENELFVYSVSHDLRAPLVNLEGFSQELALVGEDLRALLAAEGVPPATRQRGLALVDEDMATAIRFIQAGVARLSTIIDALLRLSRAGRVEYQWQCVDLNRLLARLVDSLRDTIAARGATVTVAPLPPAWGDPTALEQLFANLLDNALRYLDPARPGAIAVGHLPAADGAAEPGGPTYFVRDNGLGIPAHARATIFQVFRRVHPEVAGGEGLGLALVHRIVARHGGAIRVESTEGVGTAFLIALPARPPAPGGGPAAPPERPAEGGDDDGE